MCPLGARRGFWGCGGHQDRVTSLSEQTQEETGKGTERMSREEVYLFPKIPEKNKDMQFSIPALRVLTRLRREGISSSEERTVWECAAFQPTSASGRNYYLCHSDSQESYLYFKILQKSVFWSHDSPPVS